MERCVTNEVVRPGRGSSGTITFFSHPSSGNLLGGWRQNAARASRLSAFGLIVILTGLVAGSTLWASLTGKNAPREVDGLLLRGTLEYFPDPENPNNTNASFRRSFEWLLASNLFTGKLVGEDSQGQVDFYFAFDGTDTYSVVGASGTNASANSWGNWRGEPEALATAELRRQTRPITDGTFGSYLWLAFDSRGYFEGRTNTNNYVPPPISGEENDADPKTRAEWVLRTNAVSPESVRYFARPDYTAKPRTSEWLIATFDWLDFTNISGIRVPTLSRVEEFPGWRDRSLGPILRVNVHVSHIEQVRRSTEFRPDIKTPVLVSDRRFAFSNSPVLITYVLRDGRWLPMEHPRLQQLFADQIRPHRATSPFFIHLLFWLTVLTIGCVFGVKSWKIAKQKG
jgi:hypothetical protein